MVTQFWDETVAITIANLVNYGGQKYFIDCLIDGIQQAFEFWFPVTYWYFYQVIAQFGYFKFLCTPKLYSLQTLSLVLRVL